MFKISPVHQSH